MHSATVGSLGTELKAKGKDDPEIIKLADEVIAWGANRNAVLHGVAKSEPGTPTMPLAEFLELAEVAARDGMRLARRVVEWHQR